MDNAVLHEHPLGLTWTIEESMGRSSHALRDGDDVWLIDPVDNPVGLGRAENMGNIVGVIQLLDRHGRDCEALANRFDVPLYVNADEIEDSPFDVVQVVNGRKWKETALWWEERQALIVSEAIGTGKMFTGGHDAGVHLMLRFIPPKKRLGEFEPEHLLVGHGPPIHGARAAAALQGALERSRRNFPRALVGAFRNG